MTGPSARNYFFLIVLPLLLPGLLVAAWRCLFRTLAEQKNIYVETVVDFEEMRQLSREEGWKLKDLFVEMKKHGASSVAISEDTLASLESEGRITVLTAKEIRKLSLDEGLQQDLSVDLSSPGALWIHSEDSPLLDRIEQQLGWKLDSARITRIHRNFLLVNKSDRGFRERVGLGFSSEYFEMADEAGLGLVVRVFNYPGLTASSASRIIASIPSPASVSALLFAEEEMLGNRGELKNIIELFKNRSYRIGWVEFNTQEGIEAYLSGLSATRPFVRVHSISRKELDQNYNADRAVARWVRAVKDRSMKILYIRCFFQDDQRYIADMVRFNLRYLQRIEASLRAAGSLVAANYEQRMHEPRHMVGIMSAAERIAIALALLLGIPLLIKASYCDDLDNRWYFSMALLAVVGHFLLPKHTYLGLSGLAGAFSYSTLGVVMAFSGLEKFVGRFSGIVKYFAVMLLPSLFGGILIAGLYSEIEFLLKFDQFRGIKLAFILPVLWILLWSIKQYGRGFITLLNRPITPIMALLTMAVGLGFVIYLMRSGNLTIVKPSAAEDSFRTFLENVLVARPRNKEFLIGYPAAALFLFFYMRRCLAVLPILAIFVQMGQVSVVNTLCHFHSPLHLSLLRIFNGFWTGMVVSLPVLLIAMLFWLVILVGSRKKNSIMLAGYLGAGNYGDELLWQSFYRKIKLRIPELQIRVLLQQPPESSGNFDFLLRKDYYAIIEELFSCKALVFPGGGVLQAKTSLMSLLYYASLILAAGFAGAKVILPAQGIGPWGKYPEKFPVFTNLIEYLFKSIDYFTVRDRISCSEIAAIGLTPPPITADLAFLDHSFSARAIASAATNLRVAVVLRDSVPESANIARLLQELAAELENLRIIPVVMQAGDEKVWLDTGSRPDEIVQADPDRELFAEADLVISMRLHGCIMATIEGLPWLGIAYDPKVTGFAEACNWKICFSPAEIDRALLEKELNLMALKKVELSEKLCRKANEMARRAEAELDAVAAAISH